MFLIPSGRGSVLKELKSANDFGFGSEREGLYTTHLKFRTGGKLIAGGRVRRPGTPKIFWPLPPPASIHVTRHLKCRAFFAGFWPVFRPVSVSAAVPCKRPAFSCVHCGAFWSVQRPRFPARPISLCPCVLPSWLARLSGRLPGASLRLPPQDSPEKFDNVVAFPGTVWRGRSSGRASQLHGGETPWGAFFAWPCCRANARRIVRA